MAEVFQQITGDGYVANPIHSPEIIGVASSLLAMLGRRAIDFDCYYHGIAVMSDKDQGATQLRALVDFPVENPAISAIRGLFNRTAWFDAMITGNGQEIGVRPSLLTLTQDQRVLAQMQQTLEQEQRFGRDHLKKCRERTHHYARTLRLEKAQNIYAINTGITSGLLDLVASYYS